MSKPREQREMGEQDLFSSRLDQIVNMNQQLVRLDRAIDRPVLEQRFGEVYCDDPDMPPLSTRLMASLVILKHTFDFADEELCACWAESLHFQYLCGEEFFDQELPFDRSSMTRWCMGEERIEVLLQVSLEVAVRVGAMKSQYTRRVIVDTPSSPST